jgi:hypothetical protein
MTDRHNRRVLTGTRDAWIVVSWVVENTRPPDSFAAANRFPTRTGRLSGRPNSMLYLIPVEIPIGIGKLDGIMKVEGYVGAVGFDKLRATY